METMFGIGKQRAVILILVIALFSGCVDVGNVNTSVDPTPTPVGEITSISDIYDPETSPNFPATNRNNSKDPAVTFTEVPQNNLPSAESTALPYITPPTPVPTPTTNYACVELTSVQRQIQSLQNDRSQKNQMLYQYQSQKSNATQNNDTASASNFQTQIDELAKSITVIDQQLSSLKIRETSLSRQCYSPAT